MVRIVGHGISCVTLAHIDPQFAKDQLILLLREWYMHPNGQVPAYEWDFGSVNPPDPDAFRENSLQYRARGYRAVADYAIHRASLPEVVAELYLVGQSKRHYRQENISGRISRHGQHGVFDREKLPPGYLLGQADGTSWMAAYAKSMFSHRTPARRKRPDVRRPREQILGALRLYRARIEQPS